MANHVCSILSFSANFDELRQRIDKLDTFVAAVNENLNEVEKSVDVAEQELNVTDYSIKGLLLKPLKARLSTAETSSATPKTNLIDGEFQAVPIFKSDEYFGTRAEEANISDSI